MREQKNTGKKISDDWIGKQGFDEALYYEDVQHGIEEASENNTDSTIQERILESYRRIPSLCVTDIHVQVVDGMVTLEGEVQSKEEKKEAADIAHTMSGVKAVKNNLYY